MPEKHDLGKIVEKDDEASLRRFYAEHPDRGPSYDLFRHAIHCDSPRCVAVMIELGAEVNTPDECCSTPLMYAAQGCLEIVKLLIEAGADPNALHEDFDPELDPDRHGEPALFWAMLMRNRDVIEYLEPLTHPTLRDQARDALRRWREREAKEAGPPLPPADQALHEAALHNRTDDMRSALAAGADVNQQDRYGATPLGRVALFGNLQAVKVCLEYGADVNKPDTVGNTPLIDAVRMDNKEVVATLLEAGADPTCPNSGGHSALSFADTPWRGEILELLRKFVQNGDNWRSRSSASRKSL
jgi:cytohesin